MVIPIGGVGVPLMGPPPPEVAHRFKAGSPESRGNQLFRAIFRIFSSRAVHFQAGFKDFRGLQPYEWWHLRRTKVLAIACA